MKVAIMGAGISGLSCAKTLEMYGIKPTIFEKRNRVGDRFVNAEAMFSVLDEPIKDCIPYLKENYNINLEPIDEVNKLFIHSKNEVGTISGRLGYTNIRGRHENSYESQLSKQIKCDINFNSTYEYESLCKDFDYVVLATGDGEYSSHLGNYRCDLTCTIKGATVKGNFITNSPHVWFNYDILPKGYVWLIPFSEKEANLVIAYPDYPSNIKLDINDMWQKVYNLACNDLEQNFEITDNFEITRYMIGICNKPKVDNTYFIGNCFGTISPGLGFGQLTSILTGIYSAYDVCGKKFMINLLKNYFRIIIILLFLEDLWII